MSESKQSIFSRELTFGKKKGETNYPTKTYINLVQDNTEANNRRTVLLFLLFLVCLGIFVKFAVIDQLAKISRAEAAYRTVEAQVMAARQTNSEYDDVKKEYDEVTAWYMTDEEKMEVDKSAVFRMLESDMAPYVGIQSVQIAGNTIVVQTDVTNLQVVSRFLSALQNDSRNGFVTVTTASASKDTDTTNNDVTATVVITYGGGGN